ncbi:MAG: methyltransferase domain-containing protein [Candidatus Heimdallarchaeota archaeon]
MEWFKKNKILSIQLLEPKVGNKILDVGCGTGEDVLALSQMVGAGGKVVGIDIDEKMINEAKNKSKMVKNVEFRIGDVYNLDFENNTFHGCRADRVFQHISELEKALSEMVRVVKPGFPIIILDPDWESLLIDSPNVEFTRKFLSFHASSFANPWSGRRLANLFRKQKLKDIQVIADTLIITKYKEAVMIYLLEQYIEKGIGEKAFNESEAEAWKR